MKENYYETIDVNPENKIDSKLSIIDIKPRYYSVSIPENENKPFNDKINLKNLMDFPIIIV